MINMHGPYHIHYHSEIADLNWTQYIYIYIHSRPNHILIYFTIGVPLAGYEEPSFYHYGAEIPIEEIWFQMAIPNGHLEWFYYHIW